MKKIMILGGSENQLPLIQTAQSIGYKVVLCDFSSNNIGKEYVDIFYQVSTLDKDTVLKVAIKEKIDGITTNSEPAMAVAAYIGNKLNLPSNPYSSIQTLSQKDLFRKFLQTNNFNSPLSYSSDNYKDAVENVSEFQFPLMVKPVDSSGSRGVARIDTIDELKEVFDKALNYSKSKQVIIEEFIQRTHDYMVGGDIFVLEGKVVFWGLMNCLRDSSVNEYVPVGKSFPASITEEQFSIIEETINSIIKKLNIKYGAFNIELMFGKSNQLYMIEMNPRNGGNKIPQLLKAATGVDLLKATMQASLGVNSIDFSKKVSNKFVSLYILHAKKSGTLEKVSFKKELTNNIFETFQSKKIGDSVRKFNSADDLIGIIFLEFKTLEEMEEKIKTIDNLVEVEVI